MNLKYFLDKLNEMAAESPELLDLPVLTFTGLPIEAIMPYDRYEVASNKFIKSGIKLIYVDYE